MNILKRRRQIKDQIATAEGNVTASRRRLKEAQVKVAVPHQRLAQANHFTEMWVGALVEGYNRK